MKGASRERGREKGVERRRERRRERSDEDAQRRALTISTQKRPEQTDLKNNAPST